MSSKYSLRSIDVVFYLLYLISQNKNLSLFIDLTFLLHFLGDRRRINMRGRKIVYISSKRCFIVIHLFKILKILFKNQ